MTGFYMKCNTEMKWVNELNIIKVNHLSVNPTKWSNTLKQSVGNLPTNCLSVFDNFVGWALKGLTRKTPDQYRLTSPYLVVNMIVNIN